mgnify:CR=1 FL=1
MGNKLFNKTYNVPFGVAPIGLQGLIWPNSPNIIAEASKKYNFPFILSTVSTSDIETISKITDGEAWFQLYYPSNKTIRYDILKRAEDSGCPVLVLLCDVPSFGYRPKDIKNGLAMPPKMSLNNMIQILKCPEWALKTLYNGKNYSGIAIQKDNQDNIRVEEKYNDGIKFHTKLFYTEGSMQSEWIYDNSYISVTRFYKSGGFS